jgi:hypothetical protein
VAEPIQMKAASRRSFGIWKKYLQIHDLILAFVWHLDGAREAQTYALTCKEAIAIGAEMGWTQTRSWNEKGGYSTNHPSVELCHLLDRHSMTPELWWAKITGVARGAI